MFQYHAIISLASLIACCFAFASQDVDGPIDPVRRDAVLSAQGSVAILPRSAGGDTAGAWSQHPHVSEAVRRARAQSSDALPSHDREVLGDTSVSNDAAFGGWLDSANRHVLASEAVRRAGKGSIAAAGSGGEAVDEAIKLGVRSARTHKTDNHLQSGVGNGVSQDSAEQTSAMLAMLPKSARAPAIVLFAAGLFCGIVFTVTAVFVSRPFLPSTAASSLAAGSGLGSRAVGSIVKPTSAAELGRILETDHTIDLSRWGKRGAKTVDNLLSEIRNKKCVLKWAQDQNGRAYLQRRLRVVSLQILAETKVGDRVLKEASEGYDSKDDNVANLRDPVRKIRKGDKVLDEILLLMHSALQVPPEWVKEHCTIEQQDSVYFYGDSTAGNAYPGMAACYCNVDVKVRVRDPHAPAISGMLSLPEGEDFLVVDSINTDKVRKWVWVQPVTRSRPGRPATPSGSEAEDDGPNNDSVANRKSSRGRNSLARPSWSTRGYAASPTP